MSDDRIPCRSCSKQIVPRLVRDEGNLFVRASNEHVCPFCGTVLYETGGGLNVLGKLAWYGLLGFIALVMLVKALKAVFG